MGGKAKSRSPYKRIPPHPSQGKAIPDLLEICPKFPLDEGKGKGVIYAHAVNAENKPKVQQAD